MIEYKSFFIRVSAVFIAVTAFFHAHSHVCAENRQKMSDSRTAGRSEAMAEAKSERYEKATFAGGCFWCMQPAFDNTKGVISTAVGYTGGQKKNPSYDEVSTGKTGHREAIEVVFDPKQVAYRDLVREFWSNIDPTQNDGQFADRGFEYTTAIFYHNEEQRRIAEDSKRALEDSGKFDKPIATQILPANEFYRAEEYHQDYYKKNSSHYKQYKEGSGRGPFIREHWEDEK